jgi:hypothetical protein
MEPLNEIFGVLTSGIDADVQLHAGMLGLEFPERIFQSPITVRVLGKVEGLSGGPLLLVEKGDMMSVPSGIDTDADD